MPARILPFPHKARDARRTLAKRGFELVGEITAPDQRLGRLVLTGTIPRERGVYLFLADGDVAYVGIATRGLAARIASYCRPGLKNPKGHRHYQAMTAALRRGARIRVMVATPDPVSWNGYKVPLDVGLEAVLITEFHPAWNTRGRGGADAIAAIEATRRKAAAALRREARRMAVAA